MKEQPVPDCVEYLDVHLNLDRISRQLSEEVLEGRYTPRRPARILVEKSQGLCRLMVLPHYRDAILLESLARIFWNQVKSSAPTKNAFFEPQDHKFQKREDDDYGPFNAWLNFQESIFNFSRTRKFIVVTDIANYYDFINYSHLRNVISSLTKIEEPILDCLIYVLSEMLWQPDYMPRHLIGLPKMNLNAPRLLAHCFLYELDQVIHDYAGGDYVRYMDDIDVGVDTTVEAKRYLRDIDLILQSRHLRLNSGKTRILAARDANKHFKIIENAVLDAVEKNIEGGKYDLADLPALLLKIFQTWKKREVFNSGNGEKILKRLLRLCRQWSAFIGEDEVMKIILQRPSVRSTALRYRAHFPFDRAFIAKMIDYIRKSNVVDEATYVDVAKCVVDMRVPGTRANARLIKELGTEVGKHDYYGALAALWMLSKYGTAQSIYTHIKESCLAWKGDWQMGRMIGGMEPRVHNTMYSQRLYRLIRTNAISDAENLFEFHRSMRSESKIDPNVVNVLAAPNHTAPCKISHSKFLVILSVSRNSSVDPKVLEKVKRKHSFPALDGFYARWLPPTW